MSDAFTDQKSRILVNSPSEALFVRSIDGSSYLKTGLKIFDLLESFVQESGEENILQGFSDNGSNYVLVGKCVITTNIVRISKSKLQQSSLDYII